MLRPEASLKSLMAILKILEIEVIVFNEQKNVIYKEYCVIGCIESIDYWRLPFNCLVSSPNESKVC